MQGQREWWEEMFSACFDDEEIPTPQADRPAFEHPVLVGDEEVAVGDDLATEEDYALRGDLVQEGFEAGVHPASLVQLPTDGLLRNVRENREKQE